VPVPLRVAHRNELDPAEQAAATGQPLPLLLGRDAAGWRPVAGADRLDSLAGDLAGFETVLRELLV
jgi:hypothetical protein